MTREDKKEVVSWLIGIAFTFAIGALFKARGAEWPILYFLLTIMYRTREKK